MMKATLFCLALVGGVSAHYYEAPKEEYYVEEHKDYGYDYCSSYYPTNSEFGYPWCSEHYTGGYEKNSYDCLEYGYECEKSCIKKGSKKCYGHEEKKYYFHHPEDVRVSAHDSYKKDNYYHEEKKDYGYDYCSSYYPTYSEFGYPWCSEHYTGGYEKNSYDCLEYGYECEKSCIKKGSKKCYGHEEKKYYFHHPEDVRVSAHDSYKKDYGYDYCKSYYPTNSEFGYPWCSEHYTGGYEKNSYDCLEYGYECEKSCIKKGSKKCYGHEEKKYYFHRPQSLRHAAHDSYYHEEKKDYGYDYCSSYYPSYSEFGYPWCSEHYTGGYEKNSYDCLEYGYECEKSCIKKGSKKCYGHEEKKYYFRRPHAFRVAAHDSYKKDDYYHEEKKDYGYDYCSSYYPSYSEFGYPWCSEHYTGGYEKNSYDCLEYGYECEKSCIKTGSKKCYGHEEKKYY